jgi:predicted esterase
MIGGDRDERRRPEDFSNLEQELLKAGADVSAHLLNAGHALDDGGKDIALTLGWLAQLSE